MFSSVKTKAVSPLYLVWFTALVCIKSDGSKMDQFDFSFHDSMLYSSFIHTRQYMTQRPVSFSARHWFGFKLRSYAQTHTHPQLPNRFVSRNQAHGHRGNAEAVSHSLGLYGRKICFWCRHSWKILISGLKNTFVSLLFCLPGLITQITTEPNKEFYCCEGQSDLKWRQWWDAKKLHLLSYFLMNMYLSWLLFAFTPLHI